MLKMCLYELLILLFILSDYIYLFSSVVLSLS
jgi:hypothetical protein